MNASRPSKLGGPRHSQDGKITDDGVGRLRFDLQKNGAHPGDAEAALSSIRLALGAKQRLTKNQNRYILRALNLWASGKTLDQAFGLKRLQTGRPKIAVERQIDIAAEVLRQLLLGYNLDMAGRLAGKRKGVGGTQARLYWAQTKLSAIAVVRNERPPNRGPWSQKEKARLETLLAKDYRKLALLFSCAPVNEQN
jgi:hypothetical protein